MVKEIVWHPLGPLLSPLKTCLMSHVGDYYINSHCWGGPSCGCYSVNHCLRLGKATIAECKVTEIYFLKFLFKKILLNLLGLHWLIKFYRFQVYNSIIQYLYIVLCVHHLKLSLLSSPFISLLPSSTSSHPPFLLIIRYCCLCLCVYVCVCLLLRFSFQSFKVLALN